MQRTTLLDEDEAQPDRDFEEIGPEIGRFAVIGRLGAGGMGQVLEAHDRELDRRVAVKVLHDHAVGSATGKARLLREAQAIAKLSHPNVVAVYDVGRHRDQVYIAMEFVAGRTLGAWLEEDARPWTEIVQVFVQVAEGLQAMHELGIVHRDLKPDNILVDQRGRPRIIDFGLARSSGEPETPTDAPPAPNALLGVQLTRTGALAGTPRYMSPEQFRHDRLSPASDQFSYCVALFEALYNRSPFVGKTLGARAASVLSGEVQDPGQGPVPAELFDVLRRGLRVDADARWLSMGELAALLRDLAAAHDPDLDNPQDARGRRRTIAALVVLIVCGPGAANLALVAGWLEYDALTHLGVTVASAIAFALISVTMRSMWKESRFGRRLIGYGIGVVTTFVGHAVVGLACQQPPHESALASLVSFTGLTFLASAFIHPVLRILGFLGVGGFLVGVALPEHAVSVHNVTMTLSMLALLVIVPRRKSLPWISRAASSTGTATGG
ncbi:MAG: serine/threonine-protein kinase [Nannocystaceae bacterium]|nr:serine/threonine protein kinase [bacterium]